MRSYQRTFEVKVPVERAWEAFTDPAELTAWYSEQVTAFEPSPGGRVAVAMNNYASVEGTVEQVNRHHRIRWSEGPGLLPVTTEISVSFESTATGTRISIVHSGFGEGAAWDHELESHSRGWDRCIADLILYLERGVRFPRFHPRPLFGVVTRHLPAGLEVLEVRPDSFSERVGLSPGDLLLQIGDVGLYDMVELWTLGLTRERGEELEVWWERDGELHSAKAMV